MSFTSILDELQEMHDRKNADYGTDSDPYRNVRASEDFGIPAWVGALIRANDKMRRLMKAAQGGELVNESIEDSFKDLATYVGIGLDLYRQSQEKDEPSTSERWQRFAQTYIATTRLDAADADPSVVPTAVVPRKQEPRPWWKEGT